MWKWYCTIAQNLVSGGDSTTRRHLQTFEWKIEGLKWAEYILFRSPNKIQSAHRWVEHVVSIDRLGCVLVYFSWDLIEFFQTGKYCFQSLSRLGCQTLSGLGFSVVFSCWLTCCQIVPWSHLHIHGVVWKLTRFPKIQPQWPVCSQQSAELRTDEFNPKLSWNQF